MNEGKHESGDQRGQWKTYSLNYILLTSNSAV